MAEAFVRNTAPDLLSATQGGLPVALRDADLLFDTLPGVPEGVAMILRTGRRLGFDPVADWDLSATALRAHGQFRPGYGSAHFALTMAAPERFILREAPPRRMAPWQEALWNRRRDLGALGGMLAVLGPGMNRLADHPRFAALRLATLALVTGFVGWWGQAIVDRDAACRAADGGVLPPGVPLGGAYGDWRRSARARLDCPASGLRFALPNVQGAVPP